MPFLNQRYVGRGDAEFFGDTRPRISFSEKANDFLNVFGIEFVRGVDSSNGFKLLKRWVPKFTKTIVETISASDGRDRSNGEVKATCYLPDGNPVHPHGVDLVNHLVSNDSVWRDPLSSWFGGFELRKGGIAVNAKAMRPCATGVNPHHMPDFKRKLFGNLMASKTGNAHPKNAVCYLIGNCCDGGVYPFVVTLAKDSIVSVILMTSPSEVLRVATRRIIAGVQAYGAFVRGGLFGGKRNPIGSMVLSVQPEYSISTNVSVPSPLPTVIFPQDADLGPKSLSVNFIHLLNLQMHRRSIT